MLNPEQAAAILEKQANADWAGARLAAARALPENARKIAYALLGRDEKGRELTNTGAYWSRSKFQDEAYLLLHTLSDSDLQALLQTLFGRLAPHVQAGYRLLYSLPYQTGYYRKAFRAPHLSGATQHARFLWLRELLMNVGPYDQDIAWFAAWAPYLGWQQDAFGRLFAAVIDVGGPDGQEVFDILVASARGEHEVGAMGRHLSRALLAASRADGWDFIEQLLLAAQRQEGLRQVILETIDEAHPQAFRRMLRVILEHDLVRFSATVRAVDVWLGLSWDAASTRVVNDTLRRLLGLLEDPNAPHRVLEDPSSAPEMLYLALWSIAFEDVETAIPPATRLLSDASSERRFVAAHLLAQLKLAQASKALVAVLDDPDLAVAVCAFNALAGPTVRLDELGESSDTEIFEALERLVQRIPSKRKELKAVVWPWMVLAADRQIVTGAMLHHLVNRSPLRLIPYLSMMEPWHRAQVVEMLMEREKSDAEARITIFALVGDPSNTVREKALSAVAKFKITTEDAVKFEGLLTRKAGDLRRGIISLLLGQPDPASLASARRLISFKDRLQRLAGLEILNQMVAAQRLPSECLALAEEYRQSHPALETDEEKLLDGLSPTMEARQPVTLENGLGLYDPARRTPGTPPAQQTAEKTGLLGRLFNGKRKGINALFTDAAAAVIRSLDDLAHTHRELPMSADHGAGQTEELLGNLNWRFPVPRHDVPLEEELARLPLREELEAWWHDRPASLRDPDGLEVLRALAPFETGYWGIFGYRDVGKKDPSWLRNALRLLYADFDTQKLRYSSAVNSLLLWLLKMYPPQGAPDLLLQAVETTFSLVPQSEWHKEEGQSFNPWAEGWRNNSRLMGWLDLARYHRNQYREQWTDRHHIRFWRLLRWLDEPAQGMERLRPELDITLTACAAGGTTEADLLDQLIGPRTMRSWGASFAELRTLSGRKPTPEMSRYPLLAELVDRCRRRIIQVELARGDMSTPASHAALSLRWTGGLDTLVKVLAALGKESFMRGWSYDTVSKAAVFSHIVRSTFAGEEDSHTRFTDQMRAARVPEKRLLELALYAPQWARHVEHAIGWPQLTEAVWWLHAHTKDTAWTVDQEIRDSWTAQVSERTPLSGQGLLDGAVDVAWFGRVYSALGPERWEKLYAVAQYASGGGGHKRAQLFADAMLGRLAKEEIIGRIRSKRQQDAVRALGLLPLPNPEGEDESASREADILGRYKVIQEFVRTGKQFGSQRQASEKLAASIGMENLARAAGYPDPIRLEWAMEAKAVEDLASGPLSAAVNGVTLKLAINNWGEAELTVTKDGKALKNIPQKVKKDPAVVALKEREREVGRQASRMRRSLENAMCRGDRFTGKELRDFFSHPILRPMVERLVFVGDYGPEYLLIGYPEGLSLRSHDGELRPVRENDALRIAHSYDLLTMGEWHFWQHDLFVAERVQPFKQVFRELYVLTPAERAEGNLSRRYEGHQVNPRQALALLGSRGWVNHPEEGVKRTFHDAGISAWVTFQEGFYTPAEVEGLTTEHVHFTKRTDWKPIPMEEVPPRIFSEVMRDLDLMVSVAHRGGVDPESSASTVEMRSALISETCSMLDINNVRLQGAHALVQGKLGSYSVHLGSGIVHRQPGGALCIIPVHSQHRGRLFLPFADDDPKTAEVLSKVLLLARDTDIKDPTILEQILVSGR